MIRFEPLGFESECRYQMGQYLGEELSFRGYSFYNSVVSDTVGTRVTKRWKVDEGLCPLLTVVR